MRQRLESLIAEMIERGLQLDEARDAFEREYLRQVLERHDGNQTRTAACLEIHRNTLRRKLQDHGLL